MCGLVAKVFFWFKFDLMTHVTLPGFTQRSILKFLVNTDYSACFATPARIIRVKFGGRRLLRHWGPNKSVVFNWIVHAVSPVLPKA